MAPGNLPKIEDVAVQSKTVLLRTDLNVTFEPGTTEIADDSRIHASKPTIDLLRERGAKVVVCSHLGRPKGQVVNELRIEPVRQRVSQVLGFDVADAGGPIGDASQQVVQGLGNGDVAMLENLRFDPGEEGNDPEFAANLATLADIYVNDAFGASHRSHASIVGVAEILPSYAGLLMRAEIDALTRGLESDEHPSVAILGGAKVADKLQVVKNLALNVDDVLIGGGMVAALLAAQGANVGSTELTAAELTAADALLNDDAVANKLHLPKDVVVAETFDTASSFSEVDAREISTEGYVLDIGPETVSEYVGIISQSKKIIWNGPMGLFEWDSFASGTRHVASAIADNKDVFKLAGGGSTVEAINRLGIAQDLTHISTGGGASLEFLEGKTLPGIAALACNA